MGSEECCSIQPTTMTTHYYLRIHSDLSGKLLIISDEFKTKSDAETYKSLLSQLLASPNPRPLTKHEVTSLGLELIICEDQADDALITVTLRDAIPKLWEDFERIHEFVEETIEEILAESFSEQES